MWNRHIWDMPLPDLAPAGQIAMASKILFTFASYFTRQSLLCFYYRLVSDSAMHRFRIALHVANSFNMSVCITFIFLTIFMCTPVDAYWIYPPTGKCLDEGKVTLGAGVINCVADLLITTLPIPIVLRLQMRLRQRLAVTFLLGLGFIVTIAGIVRTYYIWKAFMDSYDETWYSYPLWIAAAVEIDLAVLTACAPALRPLIAIYARPLIASISKKSKTGTQEPSPGGSCTLDFGIEERGGREGKAMDSVDMKPLPESASDSTEVAIVLDYSNAPGVEEQKQHRALTAGNELRPPSRIQHNMSVGQSATSGPSRRESITVQIRQSFEISHCDARAATSSPAPLPHSSSKTVSRTPSRTDRRVESPFLTSGRQSPFSQPKIPEPGYSMQGKKSKEWNWPLREELVSRFARPLPPTGHTPSAPRDLNVQSGAYAASAVKVEDQSEGRKKSSGRWSFSRRMSLRTMWLGDCSSSSGDGSDMELAK